MKKLFRTFIILIATIINIILVNSCAEVVDYNNLLSGTDFTAFSCAHSSGEAVINKLNKTIIINVSSSADLGNCVVTFVLSDGAAATVNGVPQVSGVTPNDFRDTVRYLVTSGNGKNQTEWLVIMSANSNEGGQLFLSGTISENKILSSGIYTIKEDIIIAKDIRLEIRPGAILKFEEGKKIILNPGASLNAVATESKPIKFISNSSDIYWGGLVLNQAEVELNFCYFEKGGNSEDLLLLKNNSLAGIKNTVFKNCKNAAINIDNNSYFRIFESNLIENCGENTNSYPIIIENLSAISSIGNTNIINTSTGIFISAFDVKNNLKFQRQTCPFILSKGLMINSTNSSVVIEAGTLFDMFEGTSIRIAENANIKFTANGNKSQYIVFTCRNKKPGAWRGFFIGKNLLAGSVLKYCQIEYAGGNLDAATANAGAINCQATDSVFTIENCKISNPNSHGIYFHAGANAELINNNFENIPSGLENIYYAK